LQRGAVLMDAGYGASTELRASITALDLTYVAGVLPQLQYGPRPRPLPPKRWSGHGRPTKMMRCDAKHQPVSVKDLALNLLSSSWRKVIWREGSSEDFRGLVDRNRRDYAANIKLIENAFGNITLSALSDRRIRGIFKAWRDSLATRSRRQADYAWAV
jgi:SRSO17 transposase